MNANTNANANANTPTTTPISERAWRVAHALAASLGHDWATYPSPRGGTSVEAACGEWHAVVEEEVRRGEVLAWALMEAGSDEAADAAYAAAGRYRQGYGPGLAPSLRHTTEGGRASWEVRPSGSWTFMVLRLDGPALILSSSGGLRVEARCEPRHMALGVVVSAVKALMRIGEVVPPALAKLVSDSVARRAAAWPAQHKHELAGLGGRAASWAALDGLDEVAASAFLARTRPMVVRREPADCKTGRGYVSRV